MRLSGARAEKMNTNTKLSKYSYITTLVLVGVLLIAIMRVILMLMADGLFPLASALGAVTVFLAMVYLRPRFSPLRWFGIGVALALLFTLYPILYTFYLSLTNWDGISAPHFVGFYNYERMFGLGEFAGQVGPGGRGAPPGRLDRARRYRRTLPEPGQDTHLHPARVRADVAPGGQDDVGDSPRGGTGHSI